MKLRKKCKDGLGNLTKFIMDEDAKVSQKGLIVGSLGVIGFALDDIASGSSHTDHDSCSHSDSHTDNCNGSHNNNIGSNRHTSYTSHVNDHDSHCN